MIPSGLADRITIDSGRCGGRPCISGTRIEIAVVLDALAEGLTPQQVRDHYPVLETADIQAAIAYAAELARETIWKVTTS